MVTPADLVGSPVINLTDIGLDRIAGSVNDKAISDALTTWYNETHQDPRSSYRRDGNRFDRDRYLKPRGYYDQVQTARWALSDDVVGGAADGTEALAIKDTGVTCFDPDQHDVWTQLCRDLHMTEFMKQFWRRAFTDSAAILGARWGTKTYQVQGRTEFGYKRRTTFENLIVPTDLTIIDTAKVVPVGTLQFGRERLAYMASPEEAKLIDAALGIGPVTISPVSTPSRFVTRTRPTVRPEGTVDDPIYDFDVIKALMTRKYIAPLEERPELIAHGVRDFQRLYLMNSRNVIRYTRTRSEDQRFPQVRLESVFELLDLKQQLKQMDRALLIGAARYIIVITKGSDQRPAEQLEIDNLHGMAAQIAQLPVVVGDHRLKLEILTPKTDHTLDADKWKTIDTRLFARAWGSFVPTGTDQDDPIKLGRVIGQGIESVRGSQRTLIQNWLFQQVRDRNPRMTERAELDLFPTMVALAFDQEYAALVQEARSTGDASRQTYLEVLNLDQGREANNRMREEVAFDPIFRTFNPFGPQQPGPDGQPADPNDPAPGSPGERVSRQRQGGRRLGGNRNGGGAAPGTGQGKAPRNPVRRADGRRSARRARMSAEEQRDMLKIDLRALSRTDLIDNASDYRIKGRHQMRVDELVDAIADATPLYDLTDDIDDEDEDDDE